MKSIAIFVVIVVKGLFTQNVALASSGQVDCANDDGSVTYTSFFNQNGRGPNRSFRQRYYLGFKAREISPMHEVGEATIIRRTGNTTHGTMLRRVRMEGVLRQYQDPANLVQTEDVNVSNIFTCNQSGGI